jgi:hypothetical protein
MRWWVPVLCLWAACAPAPAGAAVDVAPAPPVAAVGEALVRDGFVREVAVVSETTDVFSASAIEAVRNWQFSPTYLNCTPVEVSMRVHVRFAP